MPRNTDARYGITRRDALKGLAIGSVSAVGFGGATLAKPGTGGPGENGNCDLVVPEDYASIQTAVEAATGGETICVEDGTYAEQVVLDKPLSLQAADGASPTITPADSPSSFTIAESGPTWEPMVFAYGGSEFGGEVSGSGTIDVDLSGFTLDGEEEQPTARRKPAVLYRNASGTISGNTVENMGVGGKETFGILAYGDSDVDILDNTVRDYERGGIGANGDGGAHPSPSVRIKDNTVKGSTGLGAAWGPNGIQVGFGAEGQVQNNDVADNRYSDESPVASGILLFESDGVGVRNNRVVNADVALSCGSWGWFRKSADDNKFTKNHVVDAEYGALLEAVAEPYGGALTQSDPSVSNTKVVNNLIQDDPGTSDPGGNVGVGIFVEDHLDNEYTPVAENNKLIRNRISGFETRVVDEGSRTKVRPFEP